MPLLSARPNGLATMPTVTSSLTSPFSVTRLMLPDGAGIAIVTEDISSEEAAARQAALAARFGRVLRSKGVFWLAGRDDMSGEWSQAGVVLRLRVQTYRHRCC